MIFRKHKFLLSLLFILLSALTEKNDEMQEYEHEHFARMRKRKFTAFELVETRISSKRDKEIIRELCRNLLTKVKPESIIKINII